MCRFCWFDCSQENDCYPVEATSFSYCQGLDSFFSGHYVFGALHSPNQWCQWADSWLLALCCCFFERHVTLLLLALLFLCSWLSSSPYLVLCLRVFFIIDNVWRAPSTRSPVLGYVRCLSSIIIIIIIIVIKKLITKNMSESYLDGYDKHQASCPGSQYWTGHRVLQTGL